MIVNLVLFPFHSCCVTDVNWCCFHQIDTGLPEENDYTYSRQADEEGRGVSEAEKAVLGPDGGPKDVEYASIDFSVLKRKTTGNARQKKESIETEYAQIMKKATEERVEKGKVEGEISEGKGEEVTEEEELHQSVTEEERGENTEVYSNLKDIMNSI